MRTAKHRFRDAMSFFQSLYFDDIKKGDILVLKDAAYEVVDCDKDNCKECDINPKNRHSKESCSEYVRKSVEKSKLIYATACCTRTNTHFKKVDGGL